MAYQASIPQATDKIKDSQSDILGNFQALKVLIDVNHDTFGSATEGKHKWATFPVQGLAPTTAAGEVALYSKTSPRTGFPELSIVAQSSGISYEFTAKTGAADGWTRLPSGILLKWGATSSLSAGANIVTFPTGASIEPFAVIYSVQVSAQSSGIADPNSAMYPYAIAPVSFTTFGVYVTTRSTGVIGTPLVGYYFVIGI